MSELALHLTEPDQKIAEYRRSTVPGMAHWSGSGPTGKTCRECAFWTGCGLHSGYYAKGGKHRGRIKPRSCQKYRDLMQGNVGPSIEADTKSCRYFSLAEKVPEPFDK